MIEDIAVNISKLQRKAPLLFLLVFAIIGALLIPGIFRLVDNVEPSLEKVLPQEVLEVKTMNDMRSDFGADMMYLVVLPKEPITDVRDPKLLIYMDLISQKISTHENVVSVNTLSDVVMDNNNGVIPDSIIDTKQIIGNSMYPYKLSNHDYSLAVIQVKTDTGSSAKLIKAVVDSVEDDILSLEYLNPGSDIQITGFNAIDKATFEVILSDFASITFVSMALVMLVVLLTFRSIPKAFMPMIVVMNALLWTMGIVGYLGLTITVVSMVSAAMIMGLGIDFGIHMVHTYFELRKNNSKNVAHTDTLKELLRAMTGASLTTIAGFLALLFGVLPAMKTLAIILALGIFNTLIGAVFLLPVVIRLYDRGN